MFWGYKGSEAAQDAPGTGAGSLGVLCGAGCSAQDAPGTGAGSLGVLCGVFCPRRPRDGGWEPGVLSLRLLRGKDVEGSGFVDRLGAALDAELAIDISIVPLNGAQGEEEPLADLAVRESLGNES